MEQLLVVLKDLDLKVLAMGGIVFLLTLFLKMPIKRATGKLQEDKRKAINSVIILIPIILSIILAELYCGLYLKDWLNLQVYSMSVTSYLISILIYATYSRVIVIFKGIFSGKESINSEYTKEQLKLIKQNIKTISGLIKNNEKQLKTVTAKEEELTTYLDNSTEELAKLGYDAKSLASVLSSTTESKKFLISEIERLTKELTESESKLKNKTGEKIVEQEEHEVITKGRITLKN